MEHDELRKEFMRCTRKVNKQPEWLPEFSNDEVVRNRIRKDMTTVVVSSTPRTILRRPKSKVYGK